MRTAVNSSACVEKTCAVVEFVTAYIFGCDPFFHRLERRNIITMWEFRCGTFGGRIIPPQVIDPKRPRADAVETFVRQATKALEFSDIERILLGCQPQDSTRCTADRTSMLSSR